LVEKFKNHLLNNYENTEKKKYVNTYAAFIINKLLMKKNNLPKTLYKFFKRWRVHTDKVQMDKLQLIIEEKEQLFHNMKFMKFYLFIKNSFRRNFFYFISQLKLNLQKKNEIEFFSKNYVFFENNYNIRLKNVLLGCYLIERCIQKNKKIDIDLKESQTFDYKKFNSYNFSSNKNEKILNASSNEMFIKYRNTDKNKNEQNDSILKLDDADQTFIINFMQLENNLKNKFQMYFFIWKAKSIQNRGLLNLAKISLVNRLIFFQDILSRKYFQVYSFFFSKMKSLFIEKYNLYKINFEKFDFYLKKILKNRELIYKKIFFDKIESLARNNNLIYKHEVKIKNIYLGKILERIKINFSEKHKQFFLNKLAINIKGSLLYKWTLNTSDFVDKIKTVFFRRYIHEFFYKLKIQSYIEPKFQSPKIDYLIIMNTSEVIKNLHLSIQIKTKQQKLFRLLKIIALKNEKEDISKTKSDLILSKYFYLWINMINFEKKSLIEDINSYRDLNVIFF